MIDITFASLEEKWNASITAANPNDTLQETAKEMPPRKKRKMVQHTHTDAGKEKKTNTEKTKRVFAASSLYGGGSIHPTVLSDWSIIFE